MRLLVATRCYTALTTAMMLLLSVWTHAQRYGNENALLYGGNAFYWRDAGIDTTLVSDPETGEEVVKIARVEGAIYKMNEERVYNGTQKETVPPVFNYKGHDETAYFRSMFHMRYTEMPAFTIQKMVINTAGKPVYFELLFDDASINGAQKMKWREMIEKVIVNMPRWQPGSYKGQPVLFYINPEIHIAP